jgi:glycosyltransferase involved in cell wall biosynthesis
LYPRRLLHSTANGQRGTILYVGRLEPAKKPGLLLDAFSAIANRQPGWQLEFVGEGSLRDELCANATNHGLETRVSFLGPIYDVEELAPVYARARCSVSPGFVGLTLTQSLGFGVPMAIADREPHSPEIELAREGGAVVFFEQDSAASLALTLESPAFDISDTQRSKLVAMIRERYSAEAMAQGIIEAVTNDLVEPS